MLAHAYEFCMNSFGKCPLKRLSSIKKLEKNYQFAHRTFTDDLLS